MSVSTADRITEVIRDAGGRVVGRTRLQKIFYLMTVTGFEEDAGFAYKHYGPYSEKVAVASNFGPLLGLFDEEERAASWGGTYSVYTVRDDAPQSRDPVRAEFVQLASAADAVELELAATAVYLASEGHAQPWDEVARRKPEKTLNGRIENARRLLERLRRVKTPRAIPSF